MNPLSKQKSVSLDKLNNLPIYYYSPYESDFLKKVFIDKFGKYVKKDAIMRSSTLELRNIRVAANQCFGFYPSPFIKLEQYRNPMVKFLKIDGDVNDFYSSTLYYNPNNDNPYLKKLIDFIKSHE